MDWNEYQRLAMRTHDETKDRRMIYALGLAGEAGEVAGVICSEQNCFAPSSAMKKELGDTLWYLAGTAHVFGFKLGDDIVSDVRSNPGKYEFCVIGTRFGHMLARDTGAVCEILKKHFGHEHPLDREKLRVALGQVYATLSYFQLDDIAHANIEKLKKRYPNGWDTYRSLTKSFKTWLTTIKDEEGLDGDFARSALADQRFPDSDSYDETYGYLVQSNATARAFDTLARVWERWSEARK